MQPLQFWRDRLARNFLPLLGVSTLLASLLQMASEEKFRRDPIVLIRATLKADNWSSDNDKHYRAIKALLPSRGTVGYLNGAEERGSDMVEKGKYYQTQYALAPLGVDGRQHRKLRQFEFVIGNFGQTIDAGQAATDGKLSVVQDFGNGLVLFRSPSKAHPESATP